MEKKVVVINTLGVLCLFLVEVNENCGKGDIMGIIRGIIGFCAIQIIKWKLDVRLFVHVFILEQVLIP